MLNDLSDPLSFLATRKSGSAKAMGEPGPDRAQVAAMLTLAVRVPDHGKIAPWRFIVFAGGARGRAGERLAGRWAELYPDHGSETLAFQRTLFERAPIVVVVVSSPKDHPRVPATEQLQSASAVCYNLVLAATAMGFHAQWHSDWVATDPGAMAIIGAGHGESLAGLIYIGTSTVALEDRPRPDAAKLTCWWGGQ